MGNLPNYLLYNILGGLFCDPGVINIDHTCTYHKAMDNNPWDNMYGMDNDIDNKDIGTQNHSDSMDNNHLNLLIES